MYLPVVVFKTPQDLTYTITSKTASRPPAYEIGEQVTVLYLPKRPNDAKIKSFWEIWIPSLICLLIGLFISGFGVLIFYAK